MHPAEISLGSVRPVNLIRLVPSEGKMHIWDTFVSHCTQTDVMRYFIFAEVSLCKRKQDD